MNKVLLAFAGAAAGMAPPSARASPWTSCHATARYRGMDKYGGFGRAYRLYKKEGMGAFCRVSSPPSSPPTPSGRCTTVYDRLKMNRLKQLEAEERRRGAGEARGGARAGVELGGRPGTIRVEQGYMMLFGALAGASAEFSTYPLEVVRRRMQLRGGKGTMSQVMGRRALRRMTTTLIIIVRRHGFAGLHGRRTLRRPGAAERALGYYSYEMFKRFLNVGDE